jgi:hypothetical protein
MRTQPTRNVPRQSRPAIAEEYFERKGRELVVAEDEIEAWELDAHDLDDLGDFDTARAD